jgi:hypothetical protein
MHNIIPPDRYILAFATSFATSCNIVCNIDATSCNIDATLKNNEKGEQYVE